MNRRTFVGVGAAALGGVVGLPVYATMVEPHWLDITHRNLPIANLPPDLEGKTLCQISDLHVCTYVDEDYLKHSLDRVSALRPDIVAITGDFVTWQEWEREKKRIGRLHEVMSHMPRGSLATVGILGNHDYGQTWKDPRVAATVASAVSHHGIVVLRNEVLTVNDLDLVGIDDLWAGRGDPQAALKKRAGRAAIVMSHNPDSLDEYDWAGYSGWILSGHTHGGQVKPPFLPPPVLPVKNRRYTSGEIAVDANRKVYISRGVGHLLKVRFNVRPEIAMFRLTSRQASA